MENRIKEILGLSEGHLYKQGERVGKTTGLTGSTVAAFQLPKAPGKQ